MEDLKKYHEMKKTTIIMVLSQLEYAEKYANRIVGLVNGTVKFDVSGRKLTEVERRALK
jgi:phosphonate transport system ATP-binding protein